MSPNQISVFISYAHEDEEWLKKLQARITSASTNFPLALMIQSGVSKALIFL